jgi:multidrug efflux system outer membrane protein
MRFSSRRHPAARVDVKNTVNAMPHAIVTKGVVRRTSVVGGLAATLLISACSLAPDYHPPQMVAANAYKEQGPVPPVGWAVAQPADGTRGPWWRAFNDPVLDDLQQRVERASPDLAAALARYDAARAQARLAGADLSPQVGVGGDAGRQRLSAARPLGQDRSVTYNEYSISGSLSYEIDLWGRVRNEVAAARAEAEASSADLANVRLSLQGQLADAYFRLRGLDAQHALLERTVAAYSRASDLTTTRHGGGIASGMDLNRARTVLADAKAQISEVLNQRAEVEHEIAALVGESASTFTLAAAETVGPPPAPPVALPSELLQQRPDIAEAERRIFAANARIGVARAAFFPSLTLSGSGGFEATHGALISNPATFWALGPAEILMTLLDGGRRSAQVKINRAQYDEAASAYRATVLKAFREVEDALAGSRLLAQEAADQRDAATAAQRTEALALVRYRDGASDYLEVVTAQTAALEAERAALALDTRRQQVAVALVRALGGDFRNQQAASDQHSQKSLN